MFISVIPLRHSLSTEPYTYFVWEDWRMEIHIWGLVEIPLGKNITTGIISGILPEWYKAGEGIEIRPIISILSSIQLLPEYILKVILLLSERYYIPIHKIAAFFLPSPLLSRLDKKNYILSIEPPDTSRKPKHEIHNYIDHIFSQKDMSHYIEEWTVFAFPDDIFVTLFEPHENEDSPYHTITLLNESTPTRKSQTWIDIAEKKGDIIVWTRRILYYNLSCYKRLIYVEDAFMSETFQYPSRIRNLDILKAVSDSSHLDIIIISSSPTLSLLADFRDFEMKTIKNYIP